jgi:hypothetical protein
MNKADTELAGKQYNLLCKAVERAAVALKYSTDKAVIEKASLLLHTLQTAPVYLWSKEKAEQCCAYFRDNIGSFADVFSAGLFPAVTCDHMGAVLLDHVVETSEGYRLRYAYAYMLDDDANISGRKAVYVASGLITYTFPVDQHWRKAWVTMHRYALMDEDLCPMHVPEQREIDLEEISRQDASRHVGTAIEQLAYTLHPRATVVKESTAHTQAQEARKLPPTVAPRIQDKSVHLVLMPDELRVLHQQSLHTGTHASPLPHRRRAHTRVLRHPRFKNRGRNIIVKEAAVNCKPGDVYRLPKRIYHVIKVALPET